MAEIAQLIEKMYGHHDRPQAISNMTKAASETVEAFNNSSLHNRPNRISLQLAGAARRAKGPWCRRHFFYSYRMA